MTIQIKLKRPNEKESSLLLRFRKNEKEFKFYTGKTILCKNWSTKKQEVLSGQDHHQLINKFLNNYCSELTRIVAQFEADKIVLDRDKIQAEIDKIFNKAQTEQKSAAKLDFIGFYDLFIENHAHYSGPYISILKQNRKHVICAAKLVTKEQLTHYNNLSTKKRGQLQLDPGKKLPFEKIDINFCDLFTKYLRTAKFTINVRGVEVEQNYKKNYIGKHIKELRRIIDDAMERGHITRFSMKSFSAEFEEVDAVYTNFDELQNFLNLTLEDREEIIRDKYVLNCFLGMRYSDLDGQLKKHMFQERVIDGQKYIVYTGRQIKTDNRVEFPIHQNAITILEKYGYEMPAVSEAEFNKTIKIIAEKAGFTDLFRKRETRGNNETTYNDIEKCYLISSHSGRRSFCTNYYQLGWPIGAIMAISGHKTEEEFLKYVKASIRLDVLVQHLAKIPNLNIKQAA